MSTEENKVIERRFTEEVWNRGNLAVVDELMSADYNSHDPTMPPGSAGFKQFVLMYRSAFPDVHLTIEDQMAEGDKVVSRWTARGTHQGELMGIAPTGKQVTVTGMNIERIVGGKLVEGWSNYDTLGMLQQLGVIPAPGQVG
jgi:steroid delta-isomerase-like uncharacterized protein